MIDGMSVDGCYKINTMIETLGHYLYFAGSVEDGVAAISVVSYNVSSLPLALDVPESSYQCIHLALG